MPFYPAKPYEVPHDDWFNNNSNSFENTLKSKGTIKISTVHEFFYRESEVKVGGSDNHIQKKLEKKSSKKIIISSVQNSDESLLSTSKEKYSYSQIPAKLKSIKKRSVKGNSFYKNISHRNIFNFRSYLLNLKSVFNKLRSRMVKNKLN
tara:strand:- start:168 stop:614 length:447 start_codon:yes stop_codon:yes gene_type:complete